MTVLAGLTAWCAAASLAHAASGLALVATYAADDGFDGVGATGIVSPDGKFYYGGNSSTLATYARDPGTGRLVFVAAHTDGVGGVDGIGGIDGLALSPDGTSLYAVGRTDDGVAVIARDTTSGALTFLEAFHDGVAPLDGLDGARGVVVSPDGKHVYVVAGDDGTVVAFDRNPVDGRLTAIQTLRDGVGTTDGLSGAWGIDLSPDGASVYVTGNGEDALAVFARDATDGLLSFVEVHRDGVAGVSGLAGAASVAVSSDGAFVYAGGLGAGTIAIFARNPTTGALTVAGTAPVAASADMALGPDGATLYTTAGSSVAAYVRDAVTGALTLTDLWTSGSRGLATFGTASALSVSPDGRHVYVGDLLGSAARAFQVVRAVCPQTALAGCRTPATPRASSVVARDRRGPTPDASSEQNGDLLTWVWAKGQSTPLADFGDPITSTDFALCVFDDSADPQPRMRASIPADNTCRGRPCWKASGTKLRYDDAERIPDGVGSVGLAAGIDGRAKIVAKLKGTHLNGALGRLPLPLAAPVRVQLISSTGACWEATYSTPQIDTAEQFKAKSD